MITFASVDDVSIRGTTFEGLFRSREESPTCFLYLDATVFVGVPGAILRFSATDGALLSHKTLDGLPTGLCFTHFGSNGLSPYPLLVIGESSSSSSSLSSSSCPPSPSRPLLISVYTSISFVHGSMCPHRDHSPRRSVQPWQTGPSFCWISILAIWIRCKGPTRKLPRSLYYGPSWWRARVFPRCCSRSSSIPPCTCSGLPCPPRRRGRSL